MCVENLTQPHGPGQVFGDQTRWFKLFNSSCNCCFSCSLLHGAPLSTRASGTRLQGHFVVQEHFLVGQRQQSGPLGFRMPSESYQGW